MIVLDVGHAADGHGEVYAAVAGDGHESFIAGRHRH